MAAQADSSVLGLPAARGRRLSHRLPLAWALAVVAGVLAVVVVVVPLRAAASNALSRVGYWLFEPFAPSVRGFDALPQSTRVLAADGSELGRIDGTYGTDPVHLASLPEYVPRAVLAAEDADFYHHAGVNPAALLRAAVATVHGRTEGGSTITQQLAKLDYTGSRRTLFRKFKEALYALRLEHDYTKDRILEQYLDQVYFGEGAYGLGAASRVYFGVTPDKLTVVQAATLAGIIRSPSFLDPRQRRGAVLQRRNEVLRSMAEHGWLRRDELGPDQAAPLTMEPRAARTDDMRQFIAYVKGEALGLEVLGASTESRAKRLFTGGYVIRTTLDPKAVEAGRAAARAHLGQPGDPGVAIASVQPGDGAIRLLFGGLDTRREFDVASEGQRQPGSAFKPFVYLAALRQGIDPRSIFDSSSPMTFTWKGQTFTVNNYEGEGGGMMTIDDALVHSVNTVFMQVGLKAGPERVLGAAEDAGIHTGIAAVPAVSLGGLDHGVSPLEMAAAYACFAARGVYAAPYAITSISDRRGRSVYTRTVRTRRAFDPVQVGVLTATLERVVTEGTATAAAIDRPVAGKTGTTSNSTDAWFVGFVPQLATAVWVGDPGGSTPMPRLRGRAMVGGTYPAMIFADTMKAILAGVAVQPLYTASPDQLSLTPPTSAPAVTDPSAAPSSSTSSSTTSTSMTQKATTTTTGPVTSSTVAPTTTAPPQPTTTAPPQPTTTAPPASSNTTSPNTTSPP